MRERVGRAYPSRPPARGGCPPGARPRNCPDLQTATSTPGGRRRNARVSPRTLQGARGRGKASDHHGACFTPGPAGNPRTHTRAANGHYAINGAVWRRHDGRRRKRGRGATKTPMLRGPENGDGRVWGARHANATPHACPVPRTISKGASAIDCKAKAGRAARGWPAHHHTRAGFWGERWGGPKNGAWAATGTDHPRYGTPARTSQQRLPCPHVWRAHQAHAGAHRDGHVCAGHQVCWRRHDVRRLPGYAPPFSIAIVFVCRGCPPTLTGVGEASSHGLRSAHAILPVCVTIARPHGQWRRQRRCRMPAAFRRCLHAHRRSVCARGCIHLHAFCVNAGYFCPCAHEALGRM